MELETLAAAVRAIKSKWLDDEHITEKEEAILFAYIDRLEDWRNTSLPTRTDLANAYADAMLAKRQSERKK